MPWGMKPLVDRACSRCSIMDFLRDCALGHNYISCLAALRPNRDSFIDSRMRVLPRGAPGAMIHPMTLTELRYIVALAQEQHFGRAAERCHVSQPTLSIAVKKLEEELGVLFERGKTRIIPTPLGEKIVVMAAKVLEQAAAIKDVAEAGKEQLEGPLALGTLPTIGPYLLPQFIPLLQETTNKLSLYVEEGSQADLAGKLRSGDLDAILVTAPFVEADVVTQPLFDEAFVLLLPTDHRLASKAQIAAADLVASELLLLGDGESLRQQILA